jgi:uncharacterized protein (DUF885 family)
MRSPPLPQITTYWLGYREVRDLYEDVRAARGAAFRLRDFMDGMMELGPVPVGRYRERMMLTDHSRGRVVLRVNGPP